jgi:glucan phosphorylase
MEFLIGRTLASNVSNLLLEGIAKQAVEEKGLNWVELLEQEPDAGLGNGGLGRLAACFLDSMATMQLPAMGYGLRYEYGMFRQVFRNGWQQEQPDTQRPAWKSTALREGRVSSTPPSKCAAAVLPRLSVSQIDACWRL